MCKNATVGSSTHARSESTHFIAKRLNHYRYRKVSGNLEDEYRQKFIDIELELEDCCLNA